MPISKVALLLSTKIKKPKKGENMRLQVTLDEDELFNSLWDYIENPPEHELKKYPQPLVHK